MTSRRPSIPAVAQTGEENKSASDLAMRTPIGGLLLSLTGGVGGTTPIMNAIRLLVHGGTSAKRRVVGQLVRGSVHRLSPGKMSRSGRVTVVTRKAGGDQPQPQTPNGLLPPKRIPGVAGAIRVARTTTTLRTSHTTSRSVSPLPATVDRPSGWSPRPQNTLLY